MKILSFIKKIFSGKYVQCPNCKGEKNICKRCGGKGVIETKKLTEEEKKMY